MRLLKLLEKHRMHVKYFCDLVPKHTPLDDVYIMRDDVILARLNMASVQRWVVDFDSRVESVLSLLKSDGINPQDKGAALKSLSETCMPKRLSEIYLNFIYEGDK